MRYFIEAGHSLTDPGAIANGVKEADLTREVRDLLAARLRLRGDSVTVDDCSLSLSSVLKKASLLIKPDTLFISIHFNSVSNPNATGVECFVPEVSTVKENRIAGALCNVTSNVLGINNRGVKKPSDAARGRLGVMALGCEVVLWEVCFISNPKDLKAYQSKKFELIDSIAKVL